MTRRSSRTVYPETFADKVRGWLGNNAELFREAHNQPMVSLYNKMTHESTLYTPLRGKRPGTGASADSKD